MTDTTLPETPEARAKRKAEVALLYQDGGNYIGRDTLTPARAAAEYHDSEETRLRKALTMKQLELRQAKNEIARLRDINTELLALLSDIHDRVDGEWPSADVVKIAAAIKRATGQP